MVDVKQMLPDLRKLVQELTDDLRTQSIEIRATEEFLRSGHEAYRDAGRISQSYEEWRDDYLEQVAVNWVLACVFVRFMEDNGLLDECWIAGEGIRQKWAEGAYELFFRQHPHETDREYLKHVFVEIRKIPAARELFDEKKNSLWKVNPSGDICRKLLTFFREVNPEIGGLKRSFVAGSSLIADAYCGLAPQAQFLGDLYQDLSEHARRKYALLQTPEFIQKFILDKTLTPAIDQFGLKNLRLIDAACGSGHFLLGAFDRLFEEWSKPEHGINNPVVAAQNALDSIFGVDINPFAVAITRFRLLLAAITASGTKKLNQQSYAWSVNLAVGDSLRWGRKPGFGNEREGIATQGEFDFDSKIEKLGYEEPESLRRILGQGYHVVVGNPPYIIVRDRAQSADYRSLYSTCFQKYSLGVPFTQRFWELAIRKGERIQTNAEMTSPASGYVGMITTNSFMKREFGKKLVEEFFPKTDLTHILDTSGAYIPGHGTPTVILFGRPQRPVSQTVRAVLGIKGEPSTPQDPSQGLVWRSIVKHFDIADAKDDYTSSADLSRTTFAKHPWSIGGGGAAGLMAVLDDVKENCLGDLCTSIGYASFPGLDDPFGQNRKALHRNGISEGLIKNYIDGEAIRDWSISLSSAALTPYDSDFGLNSSP